MSKRSCRMCFFFRLVENGIWLGCSHVFPFQCFVHLSHKRNQVLEMWVDCPARTCGIWSWKGKPWNWTLTTHVKWTGEGTVLVSHYDANLREQDIVQLHVSLHAETGSYFLASSAHLSLLFPMLPQATEEILKKKKDFCLKKIVLAFPSLWGDLTALYWYFFESKGEACPMETQHPIIKPSL